MNYKTLLSLIAVASMTVSAVAKADDAIVNENKTTVDKSDVPAAKAEGTDADDVLSNNFLRAMSGSKSKLSLAFTLNYSGGTVQQPFQENRPNIAAASATTLKNDFDGTFSVKYAFNSVDSMLLGFGARWLAPFATSGPGPNADGSQFAGQQTDAYNPSLTYQHIYKLGVVQSVLQLSATQWTQSDQTPLGYAQSYQVDQENMIEVGSTGLSLGGSIGAGFTVFNDVDPSNYQFQSVYQAWVSPYAEYQLTEKINLRTVTNCWTYEHYRNVDDRYAMIRDVTTQSVGVGFSVTRDLFIYPNVQFLPDNARADNTNVAVNATMNLF